MQDSFHQQYFLHTSNKTNSYGLWIIYTVAEPQSIKSMLMKWRIATTSHTWVPFFVRSRCLKNINTRMEISPDINKKARFAQWINKRAATPSITCCWKEKITSICWNKGATTKEPDGKFLSWDLLKSTRIRRWGSDLSGWFLNQVIQAVTFLSPNVGGHQQPFSPSVTYSPS